MSKPWRGLKCCPLPCAAGFFVCKLKKTSNTKKKGDKGNSAKGEAAAAQAAAEVTELGNLSTEAAAAGQQPKRKKQPKAVAVTLGAAAVDKAGRRPRAAPAQQSGGEKLPIPLPRSLFVTCSGPPVLAVCIGLSAP